MFRAILNYLRLDALLRFELVTISTQGDFVLRYVTPFGAAHASVNNVVDVDVVPLETN